MSIPAFVLLYNLANDIWWLEAGFGNGMTTSSIPVWQSETSCSHNRGRDVCIELGVNIFGVMLAYWVSPLSSLHLLKALTHDFARSGRLRSEKLHNWLAVALPFGEPLSELLFLFLQHHQLMTGILSLLSRCRSCLPYSHLS